MAAAAGIAAGTARSRLTQAALLVTGGMLLGRASGFVRELALAHRLGASTEADLAVFAIAIPDLLTGMLVGGAFGAVLIPEMHRATQRHGNQAAAALALRWTLLVAALSLPAAGLLALFAPRLVALMAPGFEGPVFADAVRLTRIALLAFPLCPLAAVVSAALQARQVVRMTSLGTVIFNAATIAAIIGCYAPGNVDAVSWGVVAAAAARLVGLLFDIRRADLHRVGFGVFARSARFRFDVLRRYGSALAATGLTVAVPAVSLAFASASAGGVATVNYAIKLVELPKGVAIALLTMVVFPRISALFASGDEARGRGLLGRGARLVLLATLPLVCCFAGGGEPFVRLIFGHGRLDDEQLRQLTLLAQLGYVSLPAVGLVTLAMSVFYARQNTRIPLLASVAATAAHLGLSWLAMDRWGLPGLLAALAASSWLHCGALWLALLRRERLNWRELLPPGPTLLLAVLSTVAGGLAWQFSRRADNALLQMLGTAALCLAAAALAWRGMVRERITPAGHSA